MLVPVSNTGHPVRFLFAADCYGQPLRIQYVDGALWFVQTDLQAVLRMRLRAPLETVPDADGLWKFERLAGVEEALLDERGLAAILGYAQGLPAVSRFAAWLTAQLPRQVRAALAEHRASVASQPTLPAVKPHPPVSVMTVEFYGSSHPVLTHEGKPYVAMKSVVEALGLDWTSQMKRIKRNQILAEGMVMMTIPLEIGGTQEIACLHLELLNGWMFGVDINRVRSELRERLLSYQRECYGVLWRHWQERAGTATAAAPPARPPLLPDAELFFALQLAFPSSTSSALLLWTLIRLDAHRRALHSNARELHRQMGGAMDRPQINRTAKKLVGEGLMEFRSGCYRVLGEPLARTLAEVLDTYRPVLDALRTVVPTLEEVAADRLGLLLSSSRLH